MSKIIFLDIDGVMNSQNRLISLYNLHKKGRITTKYYNEQKGLPYKDTLYALKYIIQNTDAKIVLSSVWRRNPDKVNLLNKIFEEYGFQIYDKTCYGVCLETVQKLGFNTSKCHSVYGDDTEKYTTDRGAEIAVWLSEHKDIESFVILDDDVADIKEYYPHNQVRTNWLKDALNMKCAKKAVKILNKGVV